MSHQIHVSIVEIDPAPPDFVSCKACNCITGAKIRCKIDEADLQKALNENFYQ